MGEQNFVYVDTDYLKELEEKAKKGDYYKGIIDGIMMCKTENSSEKPNSFDKDINVRCKDEPQTEIPEYAEWKEPFEKMTDCPWK